MDFLNLSFEQWLLALLAGFFVGVSKAGFGGVGMLTIALMATIMKGHELESTGVVLPLLIFGDILAVRAFRAHARWSVILGLLPPAVVGVIIGFFWMQHLKDVAFKPIIGWIILGLIGLQVFRQVRPLLFQNIPHTGSFAWTAGIGAGITTMIANAAGPIMTLYLLAVQLPKLAFVGTGAWYFLILNTFKVPFSAHLGFITPGSLLFNAALVPAVVAGLTTGRYCLHRIDQVFFERLLLLLTALTAAHLIIF